MINTFYTATVATYQIDHKKSEFLHLLEIVTKSLKSGEKWKQDKAARFKIERLETITSLSVWKNVPIKVAEAGRFH